MLRQIGKLTFSVLSGVAVAFIARGFGLEGNTPFFIGVGVCCVVQILIQ